MSMLFGNETVALMSQSMIDQMPMPLPLDTSETLPELMDKTTDEVMQMLKMLPLPLNTSAPIEDMLVTKSLSEMIGSMLPITKLPVDASKHSPENMEELLSMLFEEVTDPWNVTEPNPDRSFYESIMSQGIDSMLPLHLDTNKTLPELLLSVSDQALEFLPLPLGINIKASGSLPGNIGELLKLMPVDASANNIPEIITGILPMIFGNATNAIMSQSISNLLPVALDTRETIFENMDKIMQMLPVQFNMSAPMADSVSSLINMLPFPTDGTDLMDFAGSQNLPDIIEEMAAMALGPGNSTDMLMSSSISKMLPMPLDTTQTLPETMEALMQVLSPMLSTGDLGNMALAEMIESTLKELPGEVDVNKTLSETIATLTKTMSGAIPALLPPTDTTSEGTGRVDGIVVFPLSTDNALNESIAEMLGLNRTDILAARWPMDPNKPLSENVHDLMAMLPLPRHELEQIAALLPFNATAMTFTNLPFVIANLMSLPSNITNPMMDIISKMMALLPSNQTDILSDAFSPIIFPNETETIEDVMADPLGALSDAISSILPPELAISGDQLHEFSVSDLATEVSSQVGLSQFLPEMLDMAVDDMTKPIAELMSEQVPDSLLEMIGSMLPVDTTESLASLLSLDTTEPAPKLVLDIMDRVLQCAM